MGIRTLYAREFRKELENGRTRPCVFACDDEHGKDVGEFVVKFKASKEMTPFSSFSEYACSLIAINLGIRCPEPVLVEIDAGLAKIVPTDLYSTVEASTGINFACKYIHPSEPWIKGTTLIGSLHTQAVAIFTFDAFVQNPDRGSQVDKPNLLRRGDDLIAIDHETAFSFIHLLPWNVKPQLWKISQENWFLQHLFCQPLRGTAIDWSEMKSKFKVMKDSSTIHQIIESAPAEWADSDNIDKVIRYFDDTLDNTDEFIQELNKILL